MVGETISAILEDGKVTDRELAIALGVIGATVYIKSSK